MSPPSRTVQVGSQTVVFTDVGDGVPVLLLHGNPDHRHTWSRVLGALGGGYRVLAPDFPGYGDSPPPGPDFDFRPATVSRLWAGFLDAVGLEQVVLGVHDFGGPWALPLAVDHPDRVRGLVISNTPFDASYQWHRWARVWQTPVAGEVALKLTTRWLTRREMRRGDPALPMEYADASFDAMHPTAKRTLLRTYRAWADFDAVLGDYGDRLRTVTRTLPTRVVWGELDPFLPASLADRFGGEVVRLPDVGHWVPVSRPGAYAEAIRSVA